MLLSVVSVRGGVSPQLLHVYVCLLAVEASELDLERLEQAQVRVEGQLHGVFPHPQLAGRGLRGVA